MTDISAKTVSSAAGFWRVNGYGNLADLLLALRAAIDAAEARERQAVEAERERCAVIVEGVNAKAFRATYQATYTKKRFDQYGIEKAVNNALNIQSEDAAAAIRTGAKP